MKSCVVVLDNIRSVHNVGSVFRTADGAGIEEVWLVGITPTPLDRFGRVRADMAKVALGAERFVRWRHFPRGADAVAAARERGYELVVVEQTPVAENINLYTPPDRCAVVMGAERGGVSRIFCDSAHSFVQIPMHGIKESLNVSVAAGIVLYRIMEGCGAK